MSKQVINVGSAANDGTGTPTRTAFQYVNANFVELYNFIAGTTNATALPTALPLEKGGTGATTAAAARTNLGLGNAAQGTLTKSASDSTVGAVTRVGDFGLGGNSVEFIETPPLSIGEVTNLCRRVSLNAATAYGLPAGTFAVSTFATATSNAYAMFFPMNITQDIYAGSLTINSGSTSVKRFFKLLSTANTTTDANGFIKAASPIVQLFSEKIELNDEAKLQDIKFEKQGVGDYLIKGSSGFAQEGWYVEMPKDANGNVLVAVVYEQLENNDISVKTYAKKFDDETGDIVANLAKPRDIPEGHWIDLRLQELPKEVIDES